MADRNDGSIAPRRSLSGPILPPPDLSAAERDEVAAATPVGRWGGEIEIAKAVRTLIETEFITGETIRVDNGETPVSTSDDLAALWQSHQTNCQ